MVSSQSRTYKKEGTKTKEPKKTKNPKTKKPPKETAPTLLKYSLLLAISISSPLNTSACSCASNKTLSTSACVNCGVGSENVTISSAERCALISFSSIGVISCVKNVVVALKSRRGEWEVLKSWRGEWGWENKNGENQNENKNGENENKNEENENKNGKTKLNPPYSKQPP
jgi:hypothetical protein